MGDLKRERAQVPVVVARHFTTGVGDLRLGVGDDLRRGGRRRPRWRGPGPGRIGDSVMACSGADRARMRPRAGRRPTIAAVVIPSPMTAAGKQSEKPCPKPERRDPRVRRRWRLGAVAGRPPRRLAGRVAEVRQEGLRDRRRSLTRRRWTRRSATAGSTVRSAASTSRSTCSGSPVAARGASGRRSTAATSPADRAGSDASAGSGAGRCRQSRRPLGCGVRAPESRDRPRRSAAARSRTNPEALRFFATLTGSTRYAFLHRLAPSVSQPAARGQADRRPTSRC